MNLPLTSFLKTSLRLDAAVSGTTGLLMVTGAGLLGPLLGLPVPLLFWAGVALAPFAMLFMLWHRTKPLHALCYLIS